MMVVHLQNSMKELHGRASVAVLLDNMAPDLVKRLNLIGSSIERIQSIGKDGHIEEIFFRLERGGLTRSKDPPHGRTAAEFRLFQMIQFQAQVECRLELSLP